MKPLYGLLLTVCLLLTGCATQERIPAAFDAHLDSALTAAGVPPLRKAKFTGPVTFQIGGANNVATSIAKATGPLATAPAASVEATARPGVPPWVLVVGGIGALLLGLAYYFRRKLAAFVVALA